METDHNPPSSELSSLLLQAAPPSAGGYAAASAGGRGLSAPLPHGPLRGPLAFCSVTLVGFLYPAGPVVIWDLVRVDSLHPPKST
jgi:hypothetical protein